MRRLRIFSGRCRRSCVLVIPMAMLLGDVALLQRLSGESEITAMKAGGIGLVRAVVSLLVVGIGRFGARALLARGRRSVRERPGDRTADETPSSSRPIRGSGSSTVTTGVPGGGRQAARLGLDTNRPRRRCSM